MTSITNPTKQLVRGYLDARTRSDEPPAAPANIRRQLGQFSMQINNHLHSNS